MNGLRLREKLLREETDCQLVEIPICVGTIWEVLVPFPNSPLELEPQAQSVPSVFIPWV